MAKQTVETEASVAKHDKEQHRIAWKPKLKDWYDAFGGNCPACGISPEFEEVEIKPFNIGGGLKVKGLSSGEGLNY